MKQQSMEIRKSKPKANVEVKKLNKINKKLSGLFPTWAQWYLRGLCVHQVPHLLELHFIVVVY